LQHVAACCSVLQCADCLDCLPALFAPVLQRVASCCSVLSVKAVCQCCSRLCCSMLQCIAVRRSVFQCVPMLCSVLTVETVGQCCSRLSTPLRRRHPTFYACCKCVWRGRSRKNQSCLSCRGGTDRQVISYPGPSASNSKTPTLRRCRYTYIYI